MSGFLRTVGSVVGAVASVAALIPGPHQPFAAAAAVAANAAVRLTARPPAAQGQVQGYLIGANQPLPYLMGRSYSEGIEVHKVGWGGEVDDVQNPYAFFARVYSACGPVESLDSVQLDFTATSFTGTFGTVQEAAGYYENYLYLDAQLGARPESDALGAPAGGSVPNWGSVPDWGASYKLSSFAALAWSLEWSKKGRRFAGGQLPRMGAVWEGVKVYDPRLDSTFPGGSGSHRIDDETTWEYSRSPALHALAYAYGRYVGGVKVLGVDLGAASIDIASTVAWANVCDANGWHVDGTIYEGIAQGGDKWNNLKRICESGGAVPVLAGGVLSFHYQAPRTSLATLTRDDLADGAPVATLGKGWKNRHNTLVPKYRSEAHFWSYVQAAEVAIAAAVTADREAKRTERQWDLVTDVDQVSQLALYDLHQRREAGPFVLPFKSHCRGYGPGSCLTLGADLGVHPDGAVKVLVRKRTVDPVTGIVTLEMEQETDAKHTDALAATGTAPGTITLPTSATLDTAAALNLLPVGYVTAQIDSSYVTDSDPADGLLQATDTSITVETHNRTYLDIGVVSVTGDTLTTEDDGSTAIADETLYHIYYDDYSRAGGAVTLLATQDASTAATSESNPGRHYVGSITTDVIGGSGTSAGGTVPGGWGGDFYG